MPPTAGPHRLGDHPRPRDGNRQRGALPAAGARRLGAAGEKRLGRLAAVLLVDDPRFFREMLTPVLKASGYQVAARRSADEALRVIGAGAHIDVVVTDVEMPGKDGFALVEALRAEPRSARLPVIALSSATTTQAIERGAQAWYRRVRREVRPKRLVVRARRNRGRIGVAA